MAESLPHAERPQAHQGAESDRTRAVAVLRRLHSCLWALLAIVIALGACLIAIASAPGSVLPLVLAAALVMVAVICIAVMWGAAGPLQSANTSFETKHESRAELGEFVATLSHELRTPLSVILGYTDLILDAVFGQPSADEVKALHRIRHQSMQLLDLMQGILDLNRLDARGLALSLHETSVRKLMLSVQESIPDTWARPGVRLEWHGLEIQSAIYSDQTKVEMILRNLVHNALKYTERGSVRVSAAEPANASKVEFIVEDTGLGIAKDDLAKIFEIYAQGRSGPRGGGVGLGLYIVKRLTEALGGTISVTSEEGVGTRFVLTLPCGAQQRSVAA